jgi:hypothetical protein
MLRIDTRRPAYRRGIARGKRFVHPVIDALLFMLAFALPLVARMRHRVTSLLGVRKRTFRRKAHACLPARPPMLRIASSM